MRSSAGVYQTRATPDIQPIAEVTLATMLIYRDEHDREAVQKTLADVVAATLAQ